MHPKINYGLNDSNITSPLNSSGIDEYLRARDLRPGSPITEDAYEYLEPVMAENM